FSKPLKVRMRVESTTFSSRLVRGDSSQSLLPAQLLLVVSTLSEWLQLLEPHLFHEIQFSPGIKGRVVQRFHLVEDLELKLAGTQFIPSCLQFNIPMSAS